MKQVRVCSWIIGIAALGLPVAAMAELAHTTTAVNLRAGPDADYPLVRWVPEGTAVEVHGCLGDFQWCDVEVYGDRGWMHANYLVYPYRNSQVPIITYGAVIGLPILGFSIDYWDHHYQHRPWYGDRSRWAFRHRPEFFGPPVHREPRFRQPQFRPPQHRPPEFRPPAVRPEFRPPAVRPEFRPPQVGAPIQRPPDFRPSQRPDYRPPDVRPTPRPDYRPPDVRAPTGRPSAQPPAMRPPPPAMRPPPPPAANRAAPGRDPRGLRDNAGQRGGMTTGDF